MSHIKKVTLFIVVIVILLLVFGLWYNFTYSMDIIKPTQVNTTEYNRKLLIATQGSKFKNELTNRIIEQYKNDSIYINIIDITALKKSDLTSYQAILLIHTWENWKPPVMVENFINTLSESDKNKLIVMTTSGNGSYKMDGIDAITGESNIHELGTISNEIILRLNPLVNGNTE